MKTAIYKNKWFWIILMIVIISAFSWYVYAKGISLGGLTIGGK